jgi:hypothetical protein
VNTGSGGDPSKEEVKMESGDLVTGNGGHDGGGLGCWTAVNIITPTYIKLALIHK